jgi:hypothetical protein
VTVPFTTPESAHYYVWVDLQPKKPFEDIRALVKAWESTDGKSTAVPQKPELEWKIVGLPPAEQAFRWVGESYSGPPGLSVGSFKAEADKPYGLHLKVTNPSPEVQRLDPHIRISISSPDWYGRHQVASMMLTMGGGIAVIIGVALVGFEISAKLKVRRLD